ncbi:ADP-ribosylglycohydrolase-domain-containing protein [Talaromyces proteolyticus]|uniref:ADP-ribosylglycohydrolase-domain-containing protein n=1 Tax=Talaromyces proteolyticus TaxID=1131652 RepID=A0AAD4PRP2_9EURO|nr:ADP-ribosylglycohydrolase-domain-containing protein [Talaromyces proteolyticus]KAH8689354.1 ADP-ribosylglycohydrolase-domain-containing protein [Talaromyces proteolyticus]
MLEIRAGIRFTRSRKHLPSTATHPPASVPLRSYIQHQEGSQNKQADFNSCKMNRSTELEFLDLHPFVRQTALDRVRGTIFGGALGDAIGLYTEFLSRDLCLAAYPEGKFQLVEPATELHNDGHRNKFVQTGWTDDTDHALLIMLSYLHSNGQSLDPSDLAHRLQFWCEQGLRCLDRPPLGLGRTVGRVVCDPSFREDAAATAHRHWKNSNYTAAPNGSLMRTYPLGVICLGKKLDETFQIATDFSRITHADPRCIVSCCLATVLIRGIVRSDVQNEKDIDALIESSLSWIQGYIIKQTHTQDAEEPSDNYPPFDSDEFYRHVRAETLEELQLDDALKMGYVYKSLGAGILLLRLALRRIDSQGFLENLFEELITSLVMQGGDADTNASVAGPLLGALFGFNMLPGKWKYGMMHAGWLFQKCNSLASVSGIYLPPSPYNGQADSDTGVEGGKPPLTKEELYQREREFVEQYFNKSQKRANENKTYTGWVGKLLGK